jgi:predicted glycogen debranching enzyme
MAERKRAEWLEADGLGGFASGTADGIRTRRYHALLLPAVTPPTGRVVLVNGFEAWVEFPDGRSVAVSSQNFGGQGGDIVHPDGFERIVSFEPEPWPRWRYEVAPDVFLEQEILARHGVPVTLVAWRLAVPGGATIPLPDGLTLCVRPLLSGRDYHALHHENSSFRFAVEHADQHLTWRPYDGLPAIVAVTNATYTHDPLWYRNFAYEEERARGLDYVEDLASPGTLRFDFSQGEAVLVLAASTPETEALLREEPAALAGYLRTCERECRAAFPSRLHRSADAYLVKRGTGKTIVAGYPWFTDWGRDTFIAMRGLCLATGRLDEAREILIEWAGAVSEGMLPNRFADQGVAPEFNSVDASLWYIVAVAEYCRSLKLHGHKLAPADQKKLQNACKDILTEYADGTRYNIHVDADGLLACGQPGVQLTWMDAKVGNWIVTPRIGKPVEVQALWLNALWFGNTFGERWRRLYVMGCDSFQKRFWNETAGYLYDVVDVDHQPGKVDATFRPNQIFALGGLPVSLIEGPRARRMLEAVEQRLWTPIGLRSLAPREPGYRPRYEGDTLSSDSAYHQGTVWPWLAGAFVEAWVRVHENTAETRSEARQRFLAPLLAHLDEAGLGHVSEIADAEAPHTPRGCPFQAWSLGEVLRLQESVLIDAPGRHGRFRTEAAQAAHRILSSSVAMLAAV